MRAVNSYRGTACSQSFEPMRLKMLVTRCTARALQLGFHLWSPYSQHQTTLMCMETKVCLSHMKYMYMKTCIHVCICTSMLSTKYRCSTLDIGSTLIHIHRVGRLYVEMAYLLALIKEMSWTLQLQCISVICISVVLSEINRYKHIPGIAKSGFQHLQMV